MSARGSSEKIWLDKGDEIIDFSALWCHTHSFTSTRCRQARSAAAEPTNIVQQHLPWSTLHEILAAKDDQHVDAAIVKDISPIPDHPFACVLVNKVVFKVKDISVVWCNFDVHHIDCWLVGWLML